MAEQFKDSYWGGLVTKDEKVVVKGNRAVVSGVDTDGNSYQNHFRRTKDGWRFNGYSGNNGSIKDSTPKFKRNSKAVRIDSKKQQKERQNKRSGSKSSKS